MLQSAACIYINYIGPHTHTHTCIHSVLVYPCLSLFQMDLYVLARSAGMMGKIAAGSISSSIHRSSLVCPRFPMFSHPDDDNDDDPLPFGCVLMKKNLPLSSLRQSSFAIFNYWARENERKKKKSLFEFFWFWSQSAERQTDVSRSFGTIKSLSPFRLILFKLLGTHTHTLGWRRVGGTNKSGVLVSEYSSRDESDGGVAHRESWSSQHIKQNKIRTPAALLASDSHTHQISSVTSRAVLPPF